MSEPSPWRAAWADRRFRLHGYVSLGLLLFIVFFIPYFFLQILEPKPGVRLDDIVLDRLGPRDWSLLIFLLIYSAVIFTIWANRKKPYRLLLGIQCYAGLNLLRMLTLYFVTLEPPADIIPLQDPLMNYLAYDGNAYLKDLFFSGHTASLFLLFLIEQDARRRIILLSITITVATLILWQHVHYTIDVLAAPLATYLVYFVLKKIQPPEV